MAKIAVDLRRALARRATDGTPGRATARALAHGDGWRAADVVCTSGPDDRPFEERHTNYAIALVVAGTFEHRSPLGRGLMTPGSVMLGNASECFECGHHHGAGDRCVSFLFSPEYFERLAADAGARVRPDFTTHRLPPLRALAPLVVQASAGVTESGETSWEEIAVSLAAQVVALGTGRATASAEPWNAAARVSQVVRMIEGRPDAALTLGRLARMAGLSPYHFLRTFERLTGVTPHQYVLRARLREAALRLADEPGKVVDIALDCGFGDISNFNRAFRAEFRMSPRSHRHASRHRLEGLGLGGLKASLTSKPSSL